MKQNDQPRILVYASHAMLAAVTEFRLRLLGMLPTSVNSDEEMATEISASIPNLVILDLDLLNGDGMVWLERLANDECTGHVPVLCFSSEGDLRKAEDAYRSGANDYLVVPYDPVTLEDKVLRLLGEAETMRVSTNSSQPPEVSANYS